MLYHISRNGQTYGPYTLEDLQRYVASGNVLVSDLAKSDSMTEWVAVSQILAGAPAAGPAGEAAQSIPAATWNEVPGASGTAAYPYSGPGFGGLAPDPTQRQAAMAAAAAYPDAPDLHWGLVLLFGLVTCSLFMYIWNLVISAWLRRVQPNATSFFYYAGAGVLAVLQAILSFGSSVHHALSPGLHVYTDHPITSLVGVSVWVVRLIARFSQKASLEEHFNTVEPIGLELSGVMTFFFGGVYFQYHLNRIHERKQAARYASGALRSY